MKHYIIPVFIPHLGCVHECVFCNQKKITGFETPVTAAQVSAIISERLQNITQQRRIEVAFYGGSFTALPKSTQNELLAPATKALKAGYIHAIRVSTRPDCIERDTVKNLICQGVSIVELGVQSLDNDVLDKAKRGHDRQSVIKAVNRLKELGMRCGLQLMPGLPGEDWLSLIKTVRLAISLQPEFVRIYPTIVIEDTVLANLYRQGRYQPLSLEQAVVRSAYMKLVFEQAGIAVIRTGLQASAELDSKTNVLAGSYHPAFGEMVDSYIFYLMLAGFAEQKGAAYPQDIIIRHNPQDCSKIRGQYNKNINNLKQFYHIKMVSLYPDSRVKKDFLLIEFEGQSVILNKNMITSI
ncbi:MAG: radical enzyme/protein acetyltransferase, family [Firmicutes bacterium]|nr:radical enzyme/protein acetyltransferase, family [Bacillota bacterium]